MYSEQVTKEELTDEEVLALSVSDPEAFVYIVRRYEEAFKRKVRKILHSEEDVEDVVQEAFTKIYLHAERFKKVEGASFKSWGYTIVMNTAFTVYRKRQRETSRSTPMSPEMYESLPDTVHEESFGLELSDVVISVFAKMPEQLSRVLSRHFIQQVPQQTIAEEEGVTVGAIKTRVHRAKAQFRELQEQFAPFV
ncbi:MAG: RNA polymerase sigma factor, sigma-70 family [Parcubacteria group bacterium GW2011_GWA2_43_11]|nr:MAG: RNA polymerase sigma factor, sigma-70 family [Parcubacteria group bacterium GW2011_GWA2_43_11]